MKTTTTPFYLVYGFVLLLWNTVAPAQDFRAVPPAEQPNAAELAYLGGKNPNLPVDTISDTAAIQLVTAFLNDLTNGQFEAAHRRLAREFVAYGPGYNDKLEIDKPAGSVGPRWATVRGSTPDHRRWFGHDRCQWRQPGQVGLSDWTLAAGVSDRFNRNGSFPSGLISDIPERLNLSTHERTATHRLTALDSAWVAICVSGPRNAQSAGCTSPARLARTP